MLVKDNGSHKIDVWNPGDRKELLFMSTSIVLLKNHHFSMHDISMDLVCMVRICGRCTTNLQREANGQCKKIKTMQKLMVIKPEGEIWWSELNHNLSCQHLSLNWDNLNWNSNGAKTRHTRVYELIKQLLRVVWRRVKILNATITYKNQTLLLIGDHNDLLCPKVV